MRLFPNVYDAYIQVDSGVVYVSLWRHGKARQYSFLSDDYRAKAVIEYFKHTIYNYAVYVTYDANLVPTIHYSYDD